MALYSDFKSVGYFDEDVKATYSRGFVQMGNKNSSS